jgi:hypothetical protein
MKRREFIKLTTLLLSTPLLATSKITPWEIIESTLQHLFPEHKNFVGANNLNLATFLQLISKDEYFDKSDLEFLINGAKRIYKIEPEYLELSSRKKEIFLRKFEQRRFGQNWLSTLMTYGLEGMLGDPIYGGNKNGKGWSAIKHNTGLPQPKEKYGI